MPRVPQEHCELCQRERELTFHHLIPKKVHRRAFFRRTYDVHNVLQELATRIRASGSREEIASLLEEQISAALLPRCRCRRCAGQSQRVLSRVSMVRLWLV